MPKTYLIKDVNNNVVCISERELLISLGEVDITIYGLQMEHIRLLKYLYDSLGGRYPITSDNIKQLCRKE